MCLFTPVRGVALLSLSFVRLFASAAPTHGSSVFPTFNFDDTPSDSASPGSRITPRTLFSVRQCRDFSFQENTFSALCEVQRDDAGPPALVTTSVVLDNCIANQNGMMTYKTRYESYVSVTHDTS
jgi:hypothetical protein